MSEDNWDLYNEVVKKWSGIYKRRFGRLLEYDDIVQEAWVAVLQADPYDKEYEKTYLGTVIQNHLNKILADTITHRKIESEEVVEERVPNPNSDVPDQLALAKDLRDKLEIRIRKIKHGLFVWGLMETHTIKEISEIGRARGISRGMSEGNIHRIISKIRDEYKKV